MSRSFGVALFGVAAAAAVLLCAAPAPASAKTLKYMVPMRDGVELSTWVDFLEEEVPHNKTTMIERSPYGHSGIELISDLYLLLGCVAVRQDIRGSGLSQGNFSLWRTEDLDVYDTFEWISKQPWYNGKIFTVGASADGLATFTTMFLPPVGLHGQFFIVTSAQGYPIIYPGGAYRYALATFWMEKTFPKQSAGLIAELQANEAPGEWWNPLNSTGHFSNITWPTVHYAGWYDIFLVGHLAAFNGCQKLSDPSVRGKSHIVVDPLGHCQKAASYFERNTIVGRVALAFLLSFDMVLGTSQVAENVSAVSFYVMGSNEDTKTEGRFWTTLPDWPEAVMTPYYFHTDRSLSTSRPTDSSASTSYIYEPSNPVPTIGGSNLELKCGPLDQTPVESREDVIVFTTPPLTEPLALTGPISVTIYVSSNCTDTDFTAKLTDVFPASAGGQSRILNDGIVRMRWRNLANSNVPEPMVPGDIYEITISMWNTSYIFTPGHSVRVAISSSNWQRFSVNPNNGLPLNQIGKNLTAENVLYHDSTYASFLTLPVVQKSQLPEFHPLDVLTSAAEKSEPVARALDLLMKEDDETLARYGSLLLGGGGSESMEPFDSDYERGVAFENQQP